MRQLLKFLFLPLSLIYGLLSVFTFAPTITHSTNSSITLPNTDVLLNAFRAHYEQFQVLLTQVYTHQTDTYLLQLLGEDLNEFGRAVNQVKLFCCHFLVINAHHMY